MSLSIGIDSGSTATKGILFDHKDGGRIVRRFLVPTPFRPLAAIEQGWEELSADLPARPHLTLTGYGRDLASFADRRVTEISCHGLGARLLCPSVHTVIDIGGQDSKVIQLDGDGNLTDFLMNDKCAAGTGRFLEVITRTLGARVEQLDELLQGAEPHDISSMCTVFAESEAISLRSAGIPAESILAGIVRSMARRSANFIGRLGARPVVLFTGGVSHCATFRHYLAEGLGCEVATHPDAQFAGALGAALFGARRRARPHGRQIMNQEFLYLFHSTLGTVRLRKRLEQHGQQFRVCDVPRLLSAGCGLAIRLHCPPDEWQQWCQNGETAAVFRCEADGNYQELARYPADSPDMAKQTAVVGCRSHG